VYNYEADYNPQFQFGFGLSYTTFEYKDLKVSKPSIKKGEKIGVTVTVTNIGKVAGKEVVHLFTSDLYASSVTPDVKRLRRFEKIELKPGESQTVSFELEPKDLSYVGRDGKDILEAGDFEVMIDKLKSTFAVSE
jgi:beta-glucosidase